MRARKIAGVGVLHERRRHHRLLLHRTPAPLLQRDGAVSVLDLAPDTPVGLSPDTRRVGADARTARR